MAKQFQNLTVDYKKLLNLSVADRVSMTKSDYGQSILSSLTPTQYANLFPSYYKERLPDISGFTAASRGTGGTRTGYEPSTAGLTPVSTRPVGNQVPTSTVSPGRATPAYVRRLKEATGGVDISDTKAKAQLSSEKKEIFNLLKKGQISADDPRVAFLKDISEADLQKMGLVTSKEKDKTYYKASEITDDEVKAQLAKTSGGEGRNISKILTAKEGKSIVVEMDDGTVKKMTGDRNWRNNNPGNLEASPWTQKQPGYLGTDGRFAIFSNSEQGREAKNKLLFNTYKDTSIASAIEKFAPSVENDTAAYIARVSREIGVNPRTKLSDLTPEQKTIMLNAMKSVEGGKTGQTEILKKGLRIQGTPTDQQIAEAKNQIQAQREQASADTLAARAKLPAGVDSKFAQEYEKMNPGQKEATLTAIGKTGVDKFNSIYKENPQQTIQTASTGDIRTTDYHQTTRDGYIQPKGFDTKSGNGQECATLSKAFNKEAGAASTWKNRVYVDNSKIKPGVMVATLAYNDGSAGKRGQNYHTGIAITAPDKDGNFKVLDQFKGGPAKIRTMNVNTGYMAKSGYGRGAESSQIGVLSGAEKPSLTALQAARAIAEKSNDKETMAILDGSITSYQAQIAAAANKNNFAQGNVEEANKSTGVNVEKDPEAQVDGKPKTELASAEYLQQKQQQSGVGVVPERERTIPGQDMSRQHPSSVQTFRTGEPENAQQSTQQSTRQHPSSVQLFRTGEQQGVSTNEVIPVHADGGKKELDTKQITAYPIGPLKGDNSVVVDDDKKPLFTMNTDKESAHYDPNDKTVSIRPLDEKKNKLDKKPLVGKAIPVLAEGGEVDLQTSAEGAPIPKVDSSGLQATPDTTPDQAPTDSSAGNVGAMAQGNVMAPTVGSSPSVSESLRNMSANPIACPSFGRALAAANFKKSGDHFDNGSTNLR